MALIKSISGLRATLGSDLTPHLIAEYTAAFSSILPEGPIVVGYDGRPSGVWIEDLVKGTLRSCGRNVRILGMVPTPTIQLLTERSDAVGGISITASHNPAEWNGLKFVDSGGVFLDKAANEMMWGVIGSNTQSYSDQQQSGSVDQVHDAASQHINLITDILNIDTKTPQQSSQRQRVVVDAVNCSGSFIVPQLLTLLGYQPVPLYCNGSGIFPHQPEPLTENLFDLGKAVQEHHAAFGVAVDPDADRLVLYDERGAPIGEELTIALAVMAAMEQYSNGDEIVVVNYSTTRTVDDVAKKYGKKTVRAPVGEINVVRRMQELDALIGGEGSGGVIFPRVHAGRDSLVGLTLITSLLQSAGTSLRDLCKTLPRYAMIKKRIMLHGNSEAQNIIDDLRNSDHGDAIVSTEDGIHLAWDDRWLHVRASNTEPIIRLIAEAPTERDATALINLVKYHDVA